MGSWCMFICVWFISFPFFPSHAVPLCSSIGKKNITGTALPCRMLLTYCGGKSEDKTEKMCFWSGWETSSQHSPSCIGLCPICQSKAGRCSTINHQLQRTGWRMKVQSGSGRGVKVYTNVCSLNVMNGGRRKT